MAIAFGLTMLLTFVLLLVSYQAIGSLTAKWDGFHSGSLEKYSAALKGNAHLGDGVHHFKNYLLRGQDYDQKFMADMAAIELDAARYAKGNGVISEQETEALRQIKESTDAYRAAMSKLVEMKAAGATIEEIDKAIKGADKPLAAAFTRLAAYVENETEATSRTIFAVAADSKRAILIAGAFAMLLSAVFAWLITRSITMPLERAVGVADAVAKGDLTQRIEVDSKDEIGQLLQALQDMNRSLIGIVGEVHNTTMSIATASREIAQGNADLSQRTEEQAASLEETASSMGELVSTVWRNSESAKHADKLAQGTNAIAEQSGKAVGVLVQTMDSIKESSGKIQNIIGAIDGIAFQTNILALNAAVEAARAGEQGRGFAVVAGEVRNLAQRSASAAKEIKQLIGGTVEQVDAGAKQVKEAAGGIGDVVTSVQRLAVLVREISSATTEQNMSIEQVNAAIKQMDAVTQQNAAMVEEAAAASEAMQEQAEMLSQAVSFFKLEAGIRAVRANSSRGRILPAVA